MIGVPITKELNVTFSMPSICGASGTMPPAAPLAKPCEARLGPTPPAGWPTLLALRMKLRRSSLTVAAPKVLVWPKLISCERPRFRAANPGTSAPPCPVG